MMRFALVAALVLLSTAVTAKDNPAKIPVFVTSAGAVNGFTDPSKDNQDTVKDLRESIADRKTLALTDDRAAAAIVLVVMGRETAQVTAGLFGDAARDRTIRVKFQVQDFETELTASAQGGTLGSGGAWGKAAGKIAKQVEDWAIANRAKLP